MITFYIYLQKKRLTAFQYKETRDKRRKIMARRASKLGQKLGQKSKNLNSNKVASTPHKEMGILKGLSDKSTAGKGFTKGTTESLKNEAGRVKNQVEGGDDYDGNESMVKINRVEESEDEEEKNFDDDDFVKIIGSSRLGPLPDIKSSQLVDGIENN